MDKGSADPRNEHGKSAGQNGRQRPHLTPREREVVGLVAAGASNKEIAERLLIAERTVKAHLTSVFEKLGLSSRLQLAIYAISGDIPDTHQSPIDEAPAVLLEGRHGPRSTPGGAPVTQSPLIIVNPSRPEVFRVLKENFRDRVIWDRRGGERRTAQRRAGQLSATMAGRRQAERRTPLPSTWHAHGFVLAAVAGPVADAQGK